MLPTIEPLAVVFLIGALPDEISLAMESVILELACVGIAVGISQHTLSFHFVVYPSTFIFRAVTVRHDSISLPQVVHIIADVPFASCPSKRTFAILLLVNPLAIIFVATCVRVKSLLGLSFLRTVRGLLLGVGLGHLRANLLL